MAQRATELTKKRRATKVNRVGRVKKNDAVEHEPEMRAIPLDLAPLLAPYKKQGRLSLRIERLPPQTWLSQGRNNGDRSWSLASDEIEDLFYLIPENKKNTHSLAIRLIELDGGEGNTVAVLDLMVSPNASVAVAGSDSRHAEEEAPNQPVQLHSDAKSDSLRRDLAKVKEELAQREAALKDEMEERLAQAAVQAAAELRETQNALKSKYESRIKEIETRAENELRQAREAWQKDAQEIRFQSEENWRTEEAARLAEVEAQLQQKFEAALKEANAHRERAETALKDAQAKLEAEIFSNSGSQAAAAGEGKQDDKELRRLHRECERLQASLAERESALEQVRLEAEAACEQARHESRGMLLKAKEVWKAEEAARLDEAEAQWQKKYSGAQREIEALREQTNAALKYAQNEAQAQIEAQAAANGDTYAKLQAMVSEREAELARLRSEAKEDSAASDGAQEQIKQLRSQQAKLQTLVSEREAELARLRSRTTDAANAHEQTSEEIVQLREEQTKLRATVAEREAALAQSLAETKARAQAQEKAAAELKQLQDERAELRSNLSGHEAELERLRRETKERAAAHQKASDALHALHGEHRHLLATVSEREAELAKIRLEAKESVAAREKAAAELARLRDSLTTLQATVSERETELTQLRSDAYLSTTARDKAKKELGRLRDEHAMLLSRMSERENELAQLRAEAKDSTATRDKATKELDWLHREHAKLQETLSERETVLTQLRAEARDSAAARSNDEKELRRLRNECTKLQTNTAKHEKKLAQLRAVADDAIATRSEENKALRKLRKEYSKLESLASTREAELAQLRAATANASSAPSQVADEVPYALDEKPIPLADRPEEEAEVDTPKIKLVEDEPYDRDDEILPGTEIILRTNSAWSQDKLSEKSARKPKKRYYSRDTIFAAALAASVVIFYPIVVQYLPASMQLGRASAPSETTETALPEVPVENYATTTGPVNFRAGPSTAAGVISTLQAGVQVVVVEESGNWTLIRLEGEGAAAEPQEGWVSSTFLESNGPADTDAVAAIAQPGGE